MTLECPHCGASLSVNLSPATSAPSRDRPQRANDRLAGLMDREWLEAAYSQSSAEAIALQIGCNVKTVLSRLRRHGIPIRSPGGTHRRRNETERAESRSKIIDAFQVFNAEHGHPPTTAEWTSGNYTPSDRTICAMFGSWSKAISAAGLQPRTHGGNTLDHRREDRRSELLDGLRQWAAEHDGDSPTQSEWHLGRPDGCPSDARHLFVTWNAALKAAGLQTRASGQRKHSTAATPAGPKPGRNRQMVTGEGLNDKRPGTVKHFGNGRAS